jgi:carboxymethylenebutenolidase
MGSWIKLKPESGVTIAAWRADPAGTPRGGIVVIQEIFGVNSHIRSICEGYAADGFSVIAPALFDRYEKGVELGYTPPDIEHGRALKGKAGIDAALMDVASAREALKGSGKIGVVGYCWGGYVTWISASRLSGIACAVPYYGGGMLEAVEEKPRCGVMAHFGELDTGIPVAGVRKFAAAHPEVQVFIYPANHGFGCDQRGAYDPPSAKLARERTLAFFREHIG